MPTMPYEIVEFPFNGRTRRYKKYPAGSMPANDEESATWDYVKWMEKEVLAVRAVVGELWGTLCPDAGPADYAALAKRAGELAAENDRLKEELARAQTPAPKAKK